MTREEVETKLKGFFWLTPLKIVRNDGAEFGGQIPKSIAIEEDGISFNDGGTQYKVVFEQVEAICPLAKVTVKTWT